MVAIVADYRVRSRHDIKLIDSQIKAEQEAGLHGDEEQEGDF